MMVLFGRKKEEKKALACACSAAYSACETVEIASDCCAQTQEGIYCIKVLGTGCASCHAQYNNVKEAVEKMGLPAKVEYITDLQQVMKYGVMRMPALVVNEKVISIGKVLKSADVEALLRKFT